MNNKVVKNHTQKHLYTDAGDGSIAVVATMAYPLFVPYIFANW